MNSRFSLFWSVGYGKTFALGVKFLKETEKAFQVQIDNKPNLTLWFPKKAVKFEEDGDIGTVARWFSPNAFTQNMFATHGSFHRC